MKPLFSAASTTLRKCMNRGIEFSHNIIMSDHDDEDDDDGLKAYNLIQSELGQWGSTTPRRRYYFSSSDSPGIEGGHYSSQYNDDSSPNPSARAAVHQRSNDQNYSNDVMDDDVGDDGDDDGSPSSSFLSPFSNTERRGGGCPVGIQTPGHYSATPLLTNENEQDLVVMTTINDDVRGTRIDGNDVGGMDDTYRLYHDTLYAYLQSRERLTTKIIGTTSNNSSMLQQLENDSSMMQIDGEDAMMEGGEVNDEYAHVKAALDDVEVTFLESLATICFSQNAGNGDMSKNEGNFWDLCTALRAECISALFYCVNGEEVPELTFANNPATMIDRAPADVLDACLGGGDISLPLKRLNAALGWIQSCHGRKFDEALQHEYEGNDDPLLPPPRRRIMWPGTLAALQKQGKNPITSGAFYPDAPLLGNRSSSPGDVMSSLVHEDELDDARLLRACFMLFQAGRFDEATKLVTDCGQPWRAASWIGWEPLSADGSGNPTRALWKRNCLKISKMMTKMINTTIMDNNNARVLYSSIAYEAAILSILSDDVDSAMKNPVFQSWEEGVHVIIRAELGIIQDDVLRSHNTARIEATEGRGGHFPYPGIEFESYNRDVDDAPEGYSGNISAALEQDASSIARIREEGDDPFRHGMISVLIGQNALKEFIGECAIHSLETDNDYGDACMLRFITHLVLYIGTVLPEFCSQLALPSEIDGDVEGEIMPLRELLILKYVAHLSSQREFWPYVALYTSLLSNDNVIETYSSFLLRVHADQERQIMLNHARDLFPKGFDCYILRSVVRAMIMGDAQLWTRAPGEEDAPEGVSPTDARMMKSVLWLCYYPEHRPDVIVAANLLLRKLLLRSSSSDTDMYAAKFFIERILPRDILDDAVNESRKENQNIAGFISPSLVENLQLEHLSIIAFLKAHTQYNQFMNTITKTSPCHKSNKIGNEAQSKHESEIADKLERNAFRKTKMGLCKIVIELASRASDALMEMLAFGGGWLTDANSKLGNNEELESEEAKTRSDEMEAIRSTYIPRAIFMLHEVLDKTAMWLEQIVHDSNAQFGYASKDMLLALFGSFDESNRVTDELSMESLTTSSAAPGYWSKKALSMSSIVADDKYALHEALDNTEMERFLTLMAESHVSLSRSLTLLD